MKEFFHLRATGLLVQLYDLEAYIEEYDVFEKEENQAILELMRGWVGATQDILKEEFLHRFYSKTNGLIEKPEDLDKPARLKSLEDALDGVGYALQELAGNMKYMPLQPPHPTLAYLVSEAQQSTKKIDWRVETVAFKTIAEFNFSEAAMRPPELLKDRTEDDPANVLSMTSMYIDDPLMWPLILHEHGHAVLKQAHRLPSVATARANLKGKFSKLAKEMGRDFDLLASEVFCDLLALRQYGPAYLYPLVFHDLLPSTHRQLMAHQDDSAAKMRIHVPPVYRYRFLAAELRKMGYDKDPALAWFSATCDQLVKWLAPESKDRLPQEIADLYAGMFDELSALLKDVAATEFVKENQTKITSLQERLKQHLPVSASFPHADKLRETLGADSLWDLESPNEIRIMLTAGWSYLLLEMIKPLYELEISGKNDAFLPDPSGIETVVARSFEERLQRFKDGYLLLLANLRVSIETAIVTRHYLAEAA